MIIPFRRFIKKGLIAVFFTISVINSFGQNQYYQISSILSGSQSFEARDYIRMQPGFKYTASGNTFNAKINNSIVVPVTQNIAANTETPIATRTLETGLSVGTTAGIFNVSLNGAATYNVPITLPPGTANMIPSLSVAYNSNAGDGYMGVGWNIGGLSSINRVERKIYYNGVNAPVQLNTDDEFSLDGERLIKVGTEYRTEVESFSKITVLGSNSYGPTSFKVETKDGLTLEYGSTVDSKLAHSDNADKIIAYYLSKVSDKFGNYYTYTYTNNRLAGEFRIQKIDYTANVDAGITACNTVYFVYETKPTENICNKYYMGSLIADNVLLTEIRISSEGSIFHKYVFTYSSTDTDIHLTEIQEFGGDDAPYNKTVFNWNATNITPSLISSDISEVQSAAHYSIGEGFFGDYNGDGKTDFGIEARFYSAENKDVHHDPNAMSFILLDNDDIDEGNALHFSKRSDENSGSAGFSLDLDPFNKPIVYSSSTITCGLWDLIPEEYSEQLRAGTINTNTVRNTDGSYTKTLLKCTPLNRSAGGTVDISGSGINFNSDKYEDAVIIRNVYTPDEAETPELQNLFLIDPYNPLLWVSSKMFCPVITERKLTSDEGSQTYYSEFLRNTYLNDHAVEVFGREQGFPYDFNGDGLTDLVVIKWKVDECDVYYSKSNASPGYAPFSEKITYALAGLSALQGNPPLYGLNPTYKIYPLDYNGDHYLDLIIKDMLYVFDPTSSTFSVYPLPRGVVSGHDELRIGDFNGDGNSDYMYTIPNHEYISSTFYLSKGKNGEFETVTAPNAFVPDATNINGGIANAESDPNHVDPTHQEGEPINQYYFQDFNNDGKTDILEQYHNASPNWGIDYFKVYYNVNFAKGEYVEGAAIAGPGDPYSTTSSRSFPFFGDFNGDGYTDVFVKGINWSNVPKIIYFQEHPNKIKSVSNGLNQITDISYTANSFTNSTINTPTDNILPIEVVSKINQTDGIGGMVETDYGYSGAKIHRYGKGFLGFTNVSVKKDISPTSYSTMLKTYSIDNAEFYPCLTNSKLTFTISGTDKTINESVFSTSIYCFFHSKRFFPYVSTATSLENTYNTDFSSYISTTTTNTNAYSITDILNGNLTSSQTSDGQTTTLTEYAGYATKGSWCPNKPSQITTTQTKTGLAPHKLIVNYIWDVPKGTLTSQESAPGAGDPLASLPATAQSVTTSYTYNLTTGNLHTTTITGSDAGYQPVTTYEYDAKQRFVIKTTNALGHVTEATYEPRYGNILTSKDANGLITSAAYDGFGRIKQTTSPIGKTTSTTLVFVTGQDVGFNRLYVATTTAEDAAPVISYFDCLGRSVGNKTSGFGNKLIASTTYYDHYGQAIQVRNPSPNANRIVTQNTFDAMGRPKMEANYITSNADPTSLSVVSGSTANSVEYSYGVNAPENKFTVTLKDKNNRTSVQTYNKWGDLLTVADPYNKTVGYEYNSSSQPVTITAVGSITTIVYDKYGRQVNLIDPDAGTTTYIYNSWNQLTLQTDGKGNKYEMLYDMLGRVIRKKETPAGTTTFNVYTYQYDSESHGIGCIASISGGPGNMTTSYKYDNLSRNYKVTEAFDGQSFPTTYGFDSYSRVNKITYPSGFEINQTYDNLSNLTSITDINNNRIWELTDVNNIGMPYKSKLDTAGAFVKENKVTDLALPDYTKFTTTIGSNTWCNKWTYSFNSITGNMMSRQNELTQTGFSSIAPRNLTETFGYDNLDRLNTITFNSNTVSMGYEDNGNITDKTGLGTYIYPSTPAPEMPIHAPYRVGQPTETMIPLQDISYTPFNKIEQITESDVDLETDFSQLNYTYGLDNERRKMVEQKTVAGDLVSTKTKYYALNYEKETIVAGTTTNREINYIFAPDGLAAIYENKNGVNKMYYISTDVQGSINMIVNTDGTIASDLSYDAWGRRRNPQDWTYNNITLSTITDRGYTMHEHMDNFNLINMNGRAYDAKLGQFLSPDPFVQSPTYTQSYNRYAYCLNNPLKYTDPSGYLSYYEWQSTHPDGSRTDYLADNAMEWSQDQSTDFFGADFGSQGATFASGKKQDFNQMVKETFELFYQNRSVPMYNDGGPKGKGSTGRTGLVIQSKVDNSPQSGVEITDDYKQFYGSLTLSIGPQLGIALKSAIPLASAFIQGPSLEVNFKPFLRYSVIYGWSVGMDVKNNNIDWAKGYSIFGKKFEESKKYGIHEHPVFAKIEVSEQKGFILTNNEGTFFNASVGAGARVVIFGVNFEIGIEGPY
jgi:RHS repeat-associated protein